MPALNDAVINEKGDYTVTLAHNAVGISSLTMDAPGATFFEQAYGKFTELQFDPNGVFTIDAGTVILNGVNAFQPGGQTRLIGGALKLGNAQALGTAPLEILGGKLVGIANITFSNNVNASGTFTLAARSGNTFTFAGQTVLDLNSGGIISFGGGGNDGTFVWAPATLGVAHSGVATFVDVNSGTLQDGNGSLTEVLNIAASTDIAAGAMLDVYGHSEAIHDLEGSGVIASTAAGGALTVYNGNFSGDVEGDLALTVRHQLSLSGANTYTGGTTIKHGAKLLLLSAGSISGNIFDNGVLGISAGATAPSGVISGTGSIILNGGTIVLNDANTYTGGTTLNGGILQVDNAGAVGTGQITFMGGTFMGTATEALSNQLAINASATFLAAHGTTLTLNTGAGCTIAEASVSFGNSASDGVIVWDTPTGSTINEKGSITIADGTLRAGDSNFQTFLDHSLKSGHLTIDAGATLDVAGFVSTIYNPTGTGTIENSGASAAVTLNNGNFSGNLSGPIVLDISGDNTQLGGSAANYGTINILSSAELRLESASSSEVVFSAGGGAQLQFDDLSEFTGNVEGFAATDKMWFPSLGSNLTVAYSGTTTDGTLTVSSIDGSAQITMLGDYTDGVFSIKKVHNLPYVAFTPNAALASAHTDAFDFSAVPATHVAPEANVMHMHGGHGLNELAPAHNATETLHAHGFIFDHLVHDLFAHEHVGTAEAML